MTDYLPILVMSVLVIAFVLLSFVASQLLGPKRANAAKDYLVAMGVDASRLNTVSYGKERPFDDGHDESAWAKNRRAHFVIGQ